MEKTKIITQQNVTLNDGGQAQDSIKTAIKDSINTTDKTNTRAIDKVIDMQEYHEIVIDVSCEQEFLHDIITQGIADVILESGDGVEFIDGSMIVLERQNNA